MVRPQSTIVEPIVTMDDTEYHHLTHKMRRHFAGSLFCGLEQNQEEVKGWHMHLLFVACRILCVEGVETKAKEITMKGSFCFNDERKVTKILSSPLFRLYEYHEIHTLRRQS